MISTTRTGCVGIVRIFQCAARESSSLRLPLNTFVHVLRPGCMHYFRMQNSCSHFGTRLIAPIHDINIYDGFKNIY